MITSLFRPLGSMLAECLRPFMRTNKPPSRPSLLQATKVQQLEDARTLSLAPMMEYTDQHFRHLVRLVSSNTLLYTEMVAANAISHERRDRINDYIQLNPQASPETAAQNYDYKYIYRRYLAHAPTEGASVLQLGGSDPEQLRLAVKTLTEIPELNYTAVNLNCGCPSPKVAGKGCFGAALMNEPDRVASIVTAMSEASSLPVTVKCRIGVEQLEYDGTLRRFMETIAATGAVRHFDVHARVAMLSLSPAGNRQIPPLQYETVYKLVEDYPHLKFTLNGGLNTLEDVQTVLNDCPGLQGCMIGRAWAADPWRFATADTLLYGSTQPAARHRFQILEEYAKYADAEEAKAETVKELGHLRRRLLKAITPLFAGEPNSKQYRIDLDAAGKLVPTTKQWADKVPDITTPLSTLIMEAATKRLSDDVLYRSPQESYDKSQWESQGRSGEQHLRDSVVAHWQSDRKQAQMNASAP